MKGISELCGQLIVGGYVGHDPSPTFLNALRKGRRAGAILFKRNLPSWEAGLEASRRFIEAAPALSPIIAVDQEGGRVQRFRAPFLEVPAMRRLARARPELVSATADAVGRQLAALGFNVDFAPVLDVDTNPTNPVLGDRSFSRDPGTVAALGVLWIRGLQQAGVAACGKHFPGHGDTSVDSHLDLPSVDASVERLERVELVPFRAAIKAGVDAIMSAHVVVRSVDSSMPATLCQAIVGRLLREQMGFDGVVFSDDLEMRAIAGRYEIGGAAVLAIRAGCDVLLICKSESWQDEAHEALVREAERDPSFQARCEEAATRCCRLRQARPAEPFSVTSGIASLFEQANGLREQLLEL